MFLTIQNLLPFIFIALIALPLPVLILYYPLHALYEKLMQRKYYNIVKKHIDDPFSVTEEQLIRIFPGKKTKELHKIADYLDGRN